MTDEISIESEVSTPKPVAKKAKRAKAGRPKGSPNKKKAAVEGAIEPIQEVQLIRTVRGREAEDGEAPVTRREFAEMLTALVDSNKRMAEALLESRKPYVDPGRVANEEQDRLGFRLQREAMERNRKAEQNACSHMAGNRGSKPSSTDTNIHWHTNELGITNGICKSCQRWFTPDDADYAHWRMRPTQDGMPSRAGNPESFLSPGERMVPFRVAQAAAAANAQNNR